MINIAKVSTRPAARDHYDVAGRAYCGAGSGITSAATRWRPDATVNVARVCRRCLKALRVALATAAAAGDQYAAGAAEFLAPADPRRDAALVESIRATVRAARTPDPTPLELSGLTQEAYRARLLGELATVGGYEELAW